MIPGGTPGVRVMAIFDWISLLLGFAYAVLIPVGVAMVRLAIRLAQLETRVIFVEGLEQKLAQIEATLHEISVKLARLEGRSLGGDGR